MGWFRSTTCKTNTLLQTKLTTKASTDVNYALEDGVQNLVSAKDGTTEFWNSSK